MTGVRSGCLKLVPWEYPECRTIILHDLTIYIIFHKTYLQFSYSLYYGIEKKVCTLWQSFLHFYLNNCNIFVSLFSVIEEANWLTLIDDIEGIGTFDAVVCLGNSFAHLPDMTGDQSEHK